MAIDFDDDGPMTAEDALDNARVCIEAAKDAVARGKPDVAVVCYAEAEGWLRRALFLQGFPGASVRLKARAELERAAETGDSTTTRERGRDGR